MLNGSWESLKKPNFSHFNDLSSADKPRSDGTLKNNKNFVTVKKHLVNNLRKYRRSLKSLNFQCIRIFDSQFMFTVQIIQAFLISTRTKLVAVESKKRKKMCYRLASRTEQVLSVFRKIRTE